MALWQLDKRKKNADKGRGGGGTYICKRDGRAMGGGRSGGGGWGGRGKEKKLAEQGRVLRHSQYGTVNYSASRAQYTDQRVLWRGIGAARSVAVY